MKAITATLITLVLLMLVGPARACYASQTDMGELYQVFNALFYESGDADGMGSDIELLNSDYFFPTEKTCSLATPATRYAST